MFSLNILVFIWRDIRNPTAGGSEIFIHEVSKRWVKKGSKVTILTAGFKGCKPFETIDGVDIIRVGGAHTVYWKAKWYYQKHLKGKFDTVIDVINTRPFETHSFVNSGEKIVALIYQLAREFWFYEMFFPVSWLGYHILEPLWLKPYFDIPIITISESSKKSFEDFGFRNVSVIPIGINTKPLPKVPKKNKQPTLIALSRLTRAKRIDHAIQAFEIIKQTIPDAQFFIVGSGPARKSLEKMAGEGVHFFGKVSEREKSELLKSAHALLVPGLREGWCLVVTEANAVGTPAIGYDVPGLRDSIIHRKTGLLCEDNPKALAHAAIEFLSSKTLQKTLSKNALESSRHFKWDTASKVFFQKLEQRLRGEL